MENGQPFDTKFFQENTDGIYPTLTAAVNDLNLRGMSGPVVFSLVDTYYPNETYPILIGEVTGTSSTNTLTINQQRAFKQKFLVMWHNQHLLYSLDLPIM
jgi:hypothetical protein